MLIYIVGSNTKINIYVFNVNKYFYIHIYIYIYIYIYFIIIVIEISMYKSYDLIISDIIKYVFKGMDDRTCAITQ